MKNLQTILTALALLGLCSCTMTRQNSAQMPPAAPPPSEELEMSAGANPGSLYDPGGAEYLFSDNRARKIGDLVTVKIVESSKANHNAKTDTKRDTTDDMGLPNFFQDQMTQLGAIGALGKTPANHLTGFITSNPLVKLNHNGQFKGEGKTDRSSAIQAVVACRVTKILPGGLMEVEGSREIRVNEENQIVLVKGLIRPRDILTDNSITSNQLADARIEYYGKGSVADRQKPGWLIRIMDNLFPF